MLSESTVKVCTSPFFRKTFFNFVLLLGECPHRLSEFVFKELLTAFRCK